MFDLYDFPSIVLGFVICIIFGVLVSIIYLLVEKALYCRSERKNLDQARYIRELALDHRLPVDFVAHLLNDLENGGE